MDSTDLDLTTDRIVRVALKVGAFFFHFLQCSFGLSFFLLEVPGIDFSRFFVVRINFITKLYNYRDSVGSFRFDCTVGNGFLS